MARHDDEVDQPLMNQDVGRRGSEACLASILSSRNLSSARGSDLVRFKNYVMKCHELLAALSDYVDGEIPPEVCVELERHRGGMSSV